MFKKTNAPQFRSIDVEEAKSLLASNNFEGQRKLNLEKVKQYSELMKSGKMRDVDIAIATDRNSIKWLMNGQHVLSAIVLSGRPHPSIIQHYKCNTDDDLWKLFATFDVHQSRTDPQIMRGARGRFKNTLLRETPLSILHICGTGLFALSYGERPRFTRSVSKTQKPELVEKHSNEVLWVANINPRQTTETTGRFMERVGVVTAMIATYRANQEKATEFWTVVRDNEMLRKDDPRRKLHDALLITAGSPKNTYGHGTGSHIAIYSACVLWWNTWISGDKRTMIKLRAMKEIPLVKK